jgi:hypothetical protein
MTARNREESFHQRQVQLLEEAITSGPSLGFSGDIS